LVAGCVIVLLTALAIHKDYVGIREMAVFRLVNSLALPGWTWPGCAAGSGHQTGQRPGTRNTPAATAGARQVLLDDQVLAFPALQ
jgi:hypothetical protein